jgi:hypothetical protein
MSVDPQGLAARENVLCPLCRSPMWLVRTAQHTPLNGTDDEHIFVCWRCDIERKYPVLHNEAPAAAWCRPGGGWNLKVA